MIIVDCRQKSLEWYSARSGMPTASSFDMVVTATGQPSKQRQRYLYRLAGERLSGIPESTHQNESMIRGTELEAEARKTYETITWTGVKEVGFCVSDCGKYGASPDGLIGDDGLLEIKCPLPSTHVRYLLEGVLPTEYFQQVQGQLLVTNRQWLDFMSYCPGIKPFIIRVTPDRCFQSALVAELREFCSELDRIVERIRA